MWRVSFPARARRVRQAPAGGQRVRHRHVVGLRGSSRAAPRHGPPRSAALADPVHQRAVVETAAAAQPHARAVDGERGNKHDARPARVVAGSHGSPGSSNPNGVATSCPGRYSPQCSGAGESRQWCARPAAAPGRPVAATHRASRSSPARRAPARTRHTVLVAAHQGSERVRSGTAPRRPGHRRRPNGALPAAVLAKRTCSAVANGQRLQPRLSARHTAQGTGCD